LHYRPGHSYGENYRYHSLSVLLRRRYATSCTSGFMDDVTFGRNGRDAGKGWQHSASAINYVRDRGGVWCLWMLVIFVADYVLGCFVCLSVCLWLCVIKLWQQSIYKKTIIYEFWQKINMVDTPYVAYYPRND